jgi:hypothetical protein
MFLTCGTSLALNVRQIAIQPFDMGFHTSKQFIGHKHAPLSFFTDNDIVN